MSGDAYDWLVNNQCPLVYKFFLYFATLDYASLVAKFSGGSASDSRSSFQSNKQQQ